MACLYPKSTTWYPDGPAPEIWTEASVGNSSGRVLAIVISPVYHHDSVPAVMFLATDNGGIWRSDDFWQANPTWSPLIDNLPLPAESKVGLLHVPSIAVDPNNAKFIYAGTGAGVLKSADGGDSWDLIATVTAHSEPLGGLAKILVDPRQEYFNIDQNDKSSLLVYAASASGFYKSADGGKTWVKKPVILDDLDGTEHPVSLSDLEYTVSADWGTITIYAGVSDQTPKNDGSRNGIYESVDGGETWTPMTIDLVDYKTKSAVLSAAIGNITLGANHASDNELPSQSVWAAVSNTIGAKWNHSPLLNVFKLESGAWKEAGGDLPGSIDTYGGDTQAIGVSTLGAVYLGTGGWPPSVFQSTNGGQHWEEITGGTNGINPHPDNHAWASFDIGVYSGNDGGIWRFVPRAANLAGRSIWESLNTPGLQTHLVDSVAFHPTDSNILLVLLS